MQVLTDAQWAKSKRRSSCAGRVLAKRIVAPSRRSSGGSTTAPNGARSRPNSATGTMPTCVSAAGRSAACGIGSWRMWWPRESQTGLCLHRRHRCARAPEGGRSTAEQTDALSLRFDRSTGGDTQALGRSRGGLGSKIVGVCDAAGRLDDFVLVPGQAHELAPSLLLLRRLPRAPAWATETPCVNVLGCWSVVGPPRPASSTLCADKPAGLKARP
jgi:hypothetical protein